MKLKANSTAQKLRGAYYTPKGLASAIVSCIDLDGKTAILEPSCGDGVFLEALLEDGRLCPDASIEAVEIDPHAYKTAMELFNYEEKIIIENDDFFRFYKMQPSGTYDLIIGNPPYVRYQYLEPEQRTLLSDLLQEQGLKANKLINAWVGFMVACTDLLKDGGTLGFVIPAEILQVVYAEDLRKYLVQHYNQITLLTFRQLVFEDIEQEIIVFIGKIGSGKSTIRVVESENIEDLSAANIDNHLFQPVVTSTEKWTRYFINADHARFLEGLVCDERLLPLSDVAIVNVGVTTGNNSFFSLTDETSSKYNLDDFTMPLIGRSSHASGAYFTQSDWENNRAQGKRSRLLVLKDGAYSQLTKKQRCYIDEGEARGENKGYKCSIRDSWYAVPSVWTPDAFFLRRNNLYPKFVLNGCEAISTDTMHRIKLKPGIDRESILISYYNSIAFAFTELCGRSYGGGVLEMLPKEVGNILIINPIKLALSPSQKADAIERIDETLRGHRSIDSLLDYMDQEILVKRLGFDAEACMAYRNIWKALQSRRLGRGSKVETEV